VRIPLDTRLSMMYSYRMNGTRLRQLRRARGWTQQQMASHLAVSTNSVARWERDEVRITPPMEKLIHVVTARGAKEPAR
jgi:transcriptional regulator with XRE-family HTH domain